MLLQIPDLIGPHQVAECRAALATAEWVDGRVTAGVQSARSKENVQVPEGHPVAQHWGAMIVGALERNPLFLSAALPLRVFPPLFNRYSGGQAFGTHIDNAIRQIPGTSHRIRTDLSATLFLSEPEEYDGGELMVEDSFGAHSVKLPAGHMVLYPATSLHQVRPVTRGARVASFFWIQSMVASDLERTLLFDLDSAIRTLGRDVPDTPAIVGLTGAYHNLVRHWARL